MAEWDNMYRAEQPANTLYQLHPSTCPVGERLAKASPSPMEAAESQPGAQPLQWQGAVPKPGTKAACVMWWWKGLKYGSQLRGCSLMSFAVGQRQQENRDVSWRERICCLSADFFTALTLLFTRCLLWAVRFLLSPHPCCVCRVLSNDCLVN